MQIKVVGNRKFYKDYLGQKDWFDYVDLSIIGSFGVNYHVFPYNVKFDTFSSLNWFDLIALANKVRGCFYEELPGILTQYQIDYLNDRQFTYQDVGLIKALFNILIWLESDLINFPVTNLREQIASEIFDQFIIDYSSRKKTQEDIYFIPKYLTDDNLHTVSLNILTALNLICLLELTFSDGQQIVAYFLPFYKPGVTLNDFQEIDQINGRKAFVFFKELLQHRDTTLKKITNKWM